MKKKKNLKYFIIVAAIAIVSFMGYKIWGGKKDAPVRVVTTQLTINDITTTVTATGTVEPVDQVDVGTQVSGLVQKIFVDYNSVVKKGQLLAELDKTILNESVNNALASYNAALNEVNYQQQNYNRQKKMYEAQVISKADYEQAAYSLKNAQETVKQRQTALSQARTNLGYANIYSPIDGVILTKEVEEGQTVAASMSTPTLFTIAKDITKMQVEADVDEADIGNVKEGQRVTFTVDAFPNEEFNGTVKQVRLGATTTSNVVTYTVIIAADNPDQELKPGLTATITIFTKEEKDVSGLEAAAFSFNPDETLLQKYYRQQDINAAPPVAQKAEPGRRYVWIKNADGSLVQKPVTTGTSDGIHIQVTSGITGSEQVVTAMEEQSTAGPTGNSGQSPFMPKRPGSNNKKASAR